MALGDDRRAGVGAAAQAAGMDGHRGGDRELGLAGQLAVDVELRASRGALAPGEVGLAGGLEFEAQLMAPGGQLIGPCSRPMPASAASAMAPTIIRSWNGRLRSVAT